MNGVGDKVYYLLADHLGSTAVSYRSDGMETRTQSYKPWGELRPGPGTSLPTDRTYTGQRWSASIGLSFYNARWYDSALGRFAQADSVIPNPFYSPAFDRYQYVFSNPLKFVDPSGHKACDEFGPNGECIADPLWHPSSNILSGWERIPTKENEPVHSYEVGLEFVSAMKNPGWWSDYMTSTRRMWRLLIALGYGYEVSSAYGNINIQELMPQAFAKKLNALVSNYGDAGYYIFLGSLQTVRGRLDAIQDGVLKSPDNLTDAFTQTTGVLNGSLISTDPNAPYDFANPMPGKHPEELLSRLYDFANACQDPLNGCDTKSLSGTLYVLTSNSDGGAWEILFIVSYTQVMGWK